MEHGGFFPTNFAETEEVEEYEEGVFVNGQEQYRELLHDEEPLPTEEEAVMQQRSEYMEEVSSPDLFGRDMPAHEMLWYSPDNQQRMPGELSGQKQIDEWKDWVLGMTGYPQKVAEIDAWVEEQKKSGKEKFDAMMADMKRRHEELGRRVEELEKEVTACKVRFNNISGEIYGVREEDEDMLLPGARSASTPSDNTDAEEAERLRKQWETERRERLDVAMKQVKEAKVAKAAAENEAKENAAEMKRKLSSYKVELQRLEAAATQQKADLPEYVAYKWTQSRIAEHMVKVKKQQRNFEWEKNKKRFGEASRVIWGKFVVWYCKKEPRLVHKMRRPFLAWEPDGRLSGAVWIERHQAAISRTFQALCALTILLLAWYFNWMTPVTNVFSKGGSGEDVLKTIDFLDKSGALVPNTLLRPVLLDPQKKEHDDGFAFIQNSACPRTPRMFDFTASPSWEVATWNKRMPRANFSAVLFEGFAKAADKPCTCAPHFGIPAMVVYSQSVGTMVAPRVTSASKETTKVKPKDSFYFYDPEKSHQLEVPLLAKVTYMLPDGTLVERQEVGKEINMCLALCASLCKLGDFFIPD